MTISTERQALDKLLATFPSSDLLAIDWQLPDATRSFSGPWVLVTLGLRSDRALVRRQYAIWKATGAVHAVGSDGAVIDPPLFLSSTSETT